MKDKITLITKSLLAVTIAFWLGYFSRQPREKKERTIPSLTSLAVSGLKENWGDAAEIYSNETGICVIAKDGYVSEFETKTGNTRHTGFIR